MLGSMLRRYLSDDPDLVVRWTSKRAPTTALPFEIGTIDSLRNFLQKHGPFSCIINCIAILRAPGQANASERCNMVRANALFPNELAAVGAEFGAALIHVSTDAVFDPAAGRCRPSDFPAPRDFYGLTKCVGEPVGENTITIRCSLIGPNPNKRGLFEWLVGQPYNATINGFDDQLWSGVTTLQFAEMCRRVLRPSLFTQMRAASSLHHFCPNTVITKFELLQLLVDYFRPDLRLRRRAGGAITRILVSEGPLRKLFGEGEPMELAIKRLSQYSGGPT
jgi:dTDP-4-dehydrorhamnose reductase